MTSVSLRFRASVLAAFLGTAFSAAAGDIIKKRDGTTLDGTIKNETATFVEIEVRTGNIMDVQKVDKKDIVELIKATPDLVEAAQLEKLVPVEDGLSDAGYQKVLDEKLLPFLKKYPTSPHKSKIEAIVKTYQEELAKAKTGALKIEGQWVSPQELRWNAYNIEARRRRLAMQTLVAKKDNSTDYYAAYRILAELEREKPASVETNKAFELFKGVIPDFDAILDLRIQEQPILLKQAADSVKSMTADQKREYEAAKKQVDEDFKALQDEARKQKLGIPPYSLTDLKSIQDAKTALKKESDRINKINLAQEKLAAEAFQSGLKNLNDKNYLSAVRNFEDAGKVFTKETLIKDQLGVAKRAAEEERRVREASGPAAPAATDVKKPSTVPAKTAAGAPVKATTASAEEAAAEEEAPVEEEKSNMPYYLIAGAGALLLVGLIVKALSKKKDPADD
ncbi:MAG: hypothetical protein JWM59_2898 [Verrucomicrobiales bacterium]|nr:hypothetical protein [Verrucomicrobiales bacterium]